MLYQKYEDKIKRIAKIKVAVYKYRYPILAGIALLLILTGWLLVEKGKINSDLVLSVPEIVYGESYDCSADIFLGTASYQFTSAGESDAEWADGLPTAYGEYKIRVKSRRTFGFYSYGEAVDFKITQKPLDIYYDTAVVYGNAPLNAENGFSLAAGDRVKDFSLTESVLNVGITPVGLKSITIENPDGQDVTYCYAIDYDARTNINVSQKHVTVKTASNSKVYDGTPLSDSGYDEFLLCYGDKLDNIDFSASQTNVGNILNSAENIIIKNAQGDDVTDNYYFDEKFGTLTVTPRKITVKPVNITNIYNDEDFTPSEWEMLAGTLADGQVANCSFTGTIKDVGSVTTIISDFKIYSDDSKTEETTDNYTIIKEDGNNTVTARPVKIIDVKEETYKDEYFEYKEHTYAENSLEIVSEHTLKLTSKSKVKGEYYGADAFSFVFDKGEERINSANYELDISECALTISPSPVTITTESDSKKYDAMPLTNDGYTLTGLVVGHYEKVKVKGNITDVGETANSAEYTIYNNEGDVTENYAITEEFGTLTITTRKITVTANSKKQRYNGELLQNEADELTVGGDGLVDGQFATAKFNGSVRYFGTETTSIVEGSVQFFDGQNNPINTENYEITEYIEGTLEITKRYLTVKSVDGEKEYDRNVFKNDDLEDSKLSITGLVETDQIQDVVFEEKGPKIGSYDNEYDFNSIIDQFGESVYACYDVDKQYGTLWITTRKLILQFDKTTLVYNGTERTFAVDYEKEITENSEGIYIAKGSLLYGDWVKLDKDKNIKFTFNNYEIAPKVVGEYKASGNEENCVINFNDTNKDYYEIEIKGTLVINKKEITVYSKDYESKYNGNKITYDYYGVIGYGGDKVAKGDTIEVYFSNDGIIGYSDEETSAPNKIKSIQIYGNGADDVIELPQSGEIDNPYEITNYNVTVQFGTLTVKPN